jgi:hypothetical protein
VLEGRWLPSNLTVMNNLDSGPGSLRAEIAASNSGDTIVFFGPNLNGQTITLTSGELEITHSLTILGLGAGHLTISGNNQSRVFEVNGGQAVSLMAMTISNGNAQGSNGGAILNDNASLLVRGCTISNSAASGFGGGIYNISTLIVSRCTLSNDHAYEGGGIYNTGPARLTVSQSTLTRDSASFLGGGIDNLGTLTISASTLSSNRVFGSLSSGGGIYAGGLATLTNCTLSGNQTISGGQGGGLFVVGNATLTNCTLSLNLAGIGGGIYVKGPSGILNLTNTIVANTSNNPAPDIFGHVATADHNLVGNASGSTGIVNGVNGNIVGGNGHPVINALLGPLQNNGGPTQTMALLAGSPAIGHADNSKAPATDQRGLPRIEELGELTDIGAFEL